MSTTAEEHNAPEVRNDVPLLRGTTALAGSLAGFEPDGWSASSGSLISLTSLPNFGLTEGFPRQRVILASRGAP